MAKEIEATVVVLGAPDVAGAVQGATENVARRLPHVTLTVRDHPQPGGFTEIRRGLEADSSALTDLTPDVVILSVGDDVLGLETRADGPEAAVAAVRGDLLAIVGHLKQLPTHVLVANVSTVDPSQTSYTYHGLSEEPFSLRAHRLNLMLVGVSQEQGISIIDVDRLIAEIGAEGNVLAALGYSPTAAGVIGEETARILEDYGFFDERPLVAQTGSQGGRPA